MDGIQLFAGGWSEVRPARPPYGPGIEYHEEVIATGNIKISYCFGYPTNNGAWQCIEVDGDSGSLMLTENVEMGPTVDEEGLDAGGGWIETNENIAIVSIDSPITAAVEV